MTFQLINRRVHLYLGMFLMPWVLMYAVSFLVFSHLQAISAWDGRGRTTFEIEIGVGKAHWFEPPLPPNRTCGSPASGSPVSGVHGGTDRSARGLRPW